MNNKPLLMTCWLGLSATMLSVSLPAFADVAVIVHPSNNASLSAKDVERIFLGKAKSFPGGTDAKPLNLVETATARSEFDENIIGRSTAQISAFWSKQIFTGKGMPPDEVGSDAEMLEMVSNNPNAIGYVDSSAVNDSVKVIALN